MDRVLAQLASVHHAQQSWHVLLRVAWWFFLLPLAVACWTASQRALPLKVVGWAAVAIATLFWSAGVAAAINPAPATRGTAAAQHQALLPPSSQPTTSITSSPTPVVVPTAGVSLAPPVTTTPTSDAPTTTVVIVSPPPPSVAAVAPAVATHAPAPVRTTAPQPIATHTTTAPAPAPSCTLTSTGKCIQGGEFCPVAKEGQAGYDANGTRYICEDKTGTGRLHWELP